MSIRRPLIALVAAAVFLGPAALTSAAAGSLTMDARVLLQGHARVGSWMAVEVQLQNSGPAVTGELRIAAGSQGRTTFSIPVDLPTESRKSYLLHAQPPAFGRTLKVELVANGSTLASEDVAYLVHDPTQLVVGVVAEKPQGIVGELNLQPSVNGSPAVVVPLTIADLPDRVEGWAALDRLIWQDVDSDQLSPQQLEALRAWLAGGGRLVIAGGTTGIGTLSGFPDGILPFRPTATVDLPAQAVSGFVEDLPANAGQLAAMSGSLSRGRSLIVEGDRTIAAEATYGSGAVTLLGFDPSTPWLAATKGVEGLWRRFLPARTAAGSIAIADDSQLIGAVAQTPSLALPPAGGLLVLLFAYIVIIGPINYFVLKRLDRRELAWVTMPVLVVGFAVAAYTYGSLLRGTDLLLNEVAIVRGAPDVTEGTAQVYVGLFSPTRGSYQLEVPGGALLASPLSGDAFGTAQSGVLDVVQGDPSRVRDLAVGYGSLRTVRADATASVPKIHTSFALTDGVLTGTVENDSDTALEQVSVVLGSSVAVVGDLAAHASSPVRLPLSSDQFGMALGDRILGQSFEGSFNETIQRRNIRYQMLNQLTYDPNFGPRPQLDADGPVVLAFGRSRVLDVRIDGHTPRTTDNVLYYVPSSMTIAGHVLFQTDLIRPTPVKLDAQVFSKDPFTIGLGTGSVTMAYRPIAFQGSLAPDELQVAMNFGGPNALVPGGGAKIEPLPTVPAHCIDATLTNPKGCVPAVADGLPEVELWDRSGPGAWVRLPHLGQAGSFSVKDAPRYVDPTSGQVLVRFVNDAPGSQIGFGFQIGIGGEIR